MVLNRQRGVRVPVRDLTRFLARARRALRLPAESVSVCLVTDSEIARWNRAYRGKWGPTDVLSFPAGDANGSGPKPGKIFPSLYLGDIAIAQIDVEYRRLDGKSVTVPNADILVFDGDLVRDWQIYIDVTPVYA